MEAISLTFPPEAEIKKSLRATLDDFKIIAGLSGDKKKVYFSVCFLQQEDRFKCISHDVPDGKTYEKLKATLGLLGFEIEEYSSIF